jgi:hypothetical protein
MAADASLTGGELTASAAVHHQLAVEHRPGRDLFDDARRDLGEVVVRAF